MEDLYDFSFDEETYISDEESYYSSDYESSESDDDQYEEDIIVPSVQTVFPIRWMTITLHSMKFDISNTGKIKYQNGDITEGIRLNGTPYSFFQIQYEKDKFKNYYMHELVWEAFNGMPPAGWTIRHKAEYTRKPRKVYSNKLSNLTIVPNTITPLMIEKGEYIT